MRDVFECDSCGKVTAAILWLPHGWQEIFSGDGFLYFCGDSLCRAEALVYKEELGG